MDLQRMNRNRSSYVTVSCKRIWPERTVPGHEDNATEDAPDMVSQYAVRSARFAPGHSRLARQPRRRCCPYRNASVTCEVHGDKLFEIAKLNRPILIDGIWKERRLSTNEISGRNEAGWAIHILFLSR